MTRRKAFESVGVIYAGLVIYILIRFHDTLLDALLIAIPGTLGACLAALAVAYVWQRFKLP